MKKLLASILMASALLVAMPQSAQANTASDLVTKNIVTDAAGNVVSAVGGVIVDGVEWTVDQVIAFCDTITPCEWLRKESAKVLKALVTWIGDHPTEALLVQMGLMVIVPMGAEMVLVRGVGAFGGFDFLGIDAATTIVASEDSGVLGSGTLDSGLLGALSLDTSESLLEDGAIQPGLKKTLVKAAEKAAAKGEDTFSLCSESACTVAQKVIRPVWGSPESLDQHLPELLERQGYRSATGEPLDLTVQESGTGRPYHIDHKLPLSCGGTNDISNLQVLTAGENLTKGNWSNCTKIPVSLLTGI